MSMITASPPSRRTACAISTPTGPPPRMIRRRGTDFMPVTSRLVQTSSSSRRPGAGEPAGAAQEVDVVVRQPFLLAGVGVVGDHEVAPGERRLDVDFGARRRIARGLHRLARAQPRLRWDACPVGALA